MNDQSDLIDTTERKRAEIIVPLRQSVTASGETSKVNAKLLIVDDDPSARRGICDFLRRHDFEMDEASDCQSARLAFVMGRPEAVIIDYRLPDGDAIELLQKLRSIDPLIPIMILTAQSSIHLAVRAMKEGADDFFTRPLELSTLLAAVKRLVASRRVNEKANTGESTPARFPVDDRIESASLSFDGTRAGATLARECSLTLPALERLHIKRVLERLGGRVDLAAQTLGVPRSSLYHKIKRYGVAVSRV